jgi:hypothetical protein
MGFLNKLLAVGFFSVVAFADISVSPTTLAFPATRQTFPALYPKTVTISGTGTFSVGIATCSGALGFQPIYYSLTPTGTPVFSLTGTAPATLYIGPSPLNTKDTPVGAYSCSIVITPTGGANCVGLCTVTSTIIIKAPSITPLFFNDHPGNCGPLTLYFSNPICTVPNARPGGTLDPPLAGSSYVDQTFGTIVTSLTNPNQLATCADVIVSSLNLDGSRFCGVYVHYGANGSNVIISSAGSDKGTILYSSIPYDHSASGGSGLNWSGVSRSRYFYATGLSVHEVQLVDPPPTTPCSTAVTCWADTVIATDDGTTGATYISNKLDGDNTGDDWGCYSEAGGSPNRAVMVNHNTGQIYYGNFPVDWTANGYHGRNSQCTVQSPVNGNRYMVLSNFTGPFSIAVVFYLPPGGTSLSLYGTDGYLPVRSDAIAGTNPLWTGAHCTPTNAFVQGSCQPYAHSTVGFDGAGNPFIFSAEIANIEGTVNTVAALYLDAGIDNLLTPSEAGGGMHVIGLVGKSSPSQGFQDYHVGCAKTQPVCFLTEDFTNSSIGVAPQISVTVTGASNTSPITITTSPAYSGANGDSVCIASVLGNTAANGCWTISNFSGGTTFTIPPAGNGVYTASGGLTQNVASDYSVSPYPTETMIVDLSNIAAPRIVRLLQTRSVAFAGGYMGSYYGQGHGSISGDGKVFGFDSNMGKPDATNLYVAPTGVVPYGFIRAVRGLATHGQ